MPEAARLARCQPWLGTLVEMSCLADQPRSREIFNVPFAMVAQVHQQMSLQQPDSELSRLNRAPLGQWIEIAAEIGEVLLFAQLLAAQSALAFNPTFRNGANPCDAFEVEQQEYGCRARRTLPCVIDLSGVAKGYAVDRALELLLAAGAREVLVNAGGDMRHAGCHALRIAVRAAANPYAHAGVVMLCDEAMASSTSRVLDGNGLGAAAGVVDGRGRILPAARGSTVIASSAMLADALAKAVLVDGAGAEALLARHGARRVLMPEILAA